MKAYKATYNMRCKNVAYEVGKTYTYHNKLEVCSKGFHFCQFTPDVLCYYPYKKEFKLIEINVLGEVLSSYCVSATNQFKVMRVVPVKEYPDLLGMELDEQNRVASVIRNNQQTINYKYDNLDNIISIDYDGTGNRCCIFLYDNNHLATTFLPNGHVITCEYDKNGNRIKESDKDGCICTWEYDDNGNIIQEKSGLGNMQLYEYDDRNRIIKKINDNYACIYEYDCDGNMNQADYEDYNFIIKSKNDW